MKKEELKTLNKDEIMLIREELGLKESKAFAQLLNMPERTVRGWNEKRNSYPSYVIGFLELLQKLKNKEKNQ